MLIMDASVSGAKSRHAEVVPVRQSIALPPDVPVSKPPKALAPQVVSDLQADEAPMKPVFVKRNKRETDLFPVLPFFPAASYIVDIERML